MEEAGDPRSSLAGPWGPTLAVALICVITQVSSWLPWCRRTGRNVPHGWKRPLMPMCGCLRRVGATIPALRHGSPSSSGSRFLCSETIFASAF
jgi:hypothetical protein